MRGIELKWIPLLAGGLPIVASVIVMLVSIATDQIDACNPFLHGCTSISRAARKLPSLMIFRAIMIPAAIMMMMFWFLTLRWLRQVGDDAPRTPVILCAIGIIGGLFMILYVTYLGTDGDTYQLLRRYGTTIFFAFTYLAQLMLTRRIQVLGERRSLIIPVILYRVLVGLGALLLILGLISIPIQHYYDVKTVENVIEWNFGLLMCVYFVLYFFAWDATRFTASTFVRDG